MSGLTVTVSGLDDWTRSLSADIGPAITAALIATAEAGRDIISPYPPAPVPGNPWYERGYGTKYRRKDGRVTGRKTSETLGRKWKVVPAGRFRTQLTNAASYSAFVHDSEQQTAQHAQTGWKTELDMEQELESAGALTQSLEQAISKILEAT